MGLRINDIVPNFTAQTDKGEIKFHDWIGDSWAILFSHPKDFTPFAQQSLALSHSSLTSGTNAAAKSSAFPLTA